MMKKFPSKKYKSFNANEINKNKDLIGQLQIKKAKSITKNISIKKEEIINYDKSQKEILLSLIKNSQLNLLMQLGKGNCPNGKDNEKIDIIKNFLIDLKSFLAYILNEKIRNKDNLQLNVNLKKEKLQTEISNNLKYDNYEKNNIINTNIKNRIKETSKMVETEMVEKNYVGSEVSKLKLQNFKTENEIVKTDFSIIMIRRTLNYLKHTIIFQEDNREIYCNNNINQEKIDKALNYMKQMQIDKLNKINNKNNKKKMEQERYLKTINKLKSDITTRNNILENDIIYELSIEDKFTSS